MLERDYTDLPPDLWLTIAAVLVEEDAIEALLVHVPGEED